jgi:diguanylate cyclase (GGDEF)-like protein/PAS domain S-box-containing protein
MTLPPPGVNPYLDRNIAGYEGYDVVVNTLAGEELASIKRIPAAQWYLYTGMSTEEAFAPVRALQERFILGALLLTVVAGSLAWWMLNRQLTPMFATASKLTQMAESSESPQPLPITRQDEVGALIGSFNHLLLRMGQHREALQESEENLAITLNSIGDAVIATDPNGRVTRMNPTAERLTGWTIADAVGHPLMDVFRIVNATTRETVPDPVLRVVALGQVVDLANHTVLLAKGGLEYQIADSAAPIRNGAREIVGVVLVFSDVTERYRTELALLNSEQSYRSLLDNLSSGVVVHAPDTSILLSNPMAATLLGLTRDQLLGKTAMDPEWCFLDDDGTLMPTKDYPVNRVLDSGERLQNYVVGVRRSDRSEPTWMLCNAYPMHDANGNILQVVVTFTDITVRKQAELQIQTMAFTDALTGLPNRRLLLDRLVQALAAASRHGHQNALMFIDLDNFKTINDTLGHDIGDMLLRQIALRLNSCVRDGDTVARLGGDEFVVLLKVLSTNAQEAAANAQMVAAKILNALAEPYELEGQRHHSTASIGVTLFGGGQREEVEEPLKRAELAMYQAKTTGRNTLRFFEPDMRTVVAARAALEAELHEAVANDQFVLYYQGQGTGHDHMTGAEALVRWQHPKRGLVSPSEFIPIAETSGLILPLGRWVLKTACQQLANWATRPERAHLTMAVNVSARQFRHSDFVQDVLAILQATGANPQRLKLELTESMLVDNVENLITKMNALKAQGVGFSLDDFGTGYSSLSYLKRLPIDQLKIDQGFITDILTDPGDAAIAKTVVALADSLGLSVIAEGVETEAQQEFLAALGCNNYQGYLFCRPLPIQEFEAFAGRV